MKGAVSMRFESKLSAPAEHVWEWITSVKGISAEMWPYFRMTIPRHIQSLTDIQIKLNVPMFRSYVLLFGFLPIDYSDMTLLELDEKRGFIEQSPMGSMKLWRHERRIVPCPSEPGSEPGSVILLDQLTFSPRFAKGLTAWFIHRVFTHRHKVLRENLGGLAFASHPGETVCSAEPD